MRGEPYITRLGMQMSRETWGNFRWEFLSSMLYSFFNVVFNQFYVPIAIRHGASDLHVGLLSAAPAIGLLFSPVWASLSERGTSAKPYVFYPNFVGRLLIMLPAFFAVPWVFVAVALCYQVLMGVQAPAYATLMTRIYPADLRGRLMGNVRVAMGLLMIPLAYAVGQWIDHAGSPGPLLTAAITGALSIFVFSNVRERRPDTAAPPPAKGRIAALAGQLGLIRENRKLLVFLAATTLSGFGNMLANPLYSIIQVDKLELSNAEIGYIRMAYFACLLTSYWIVGWVIDRYSPKLAMCFGIIAFAVVPLLYGLVGTLPAAIAAGGVQGVGDAIWEIGCMTYIFRVAKGREGVVFSLHLMLFGIRGTIGPILSTALMNVISFPIMLSAASLCSLLGLILFLADRSERPGLKAHESKA